MGIMEANRVWKLTVEEKLKVLVGQTRMLLLFEETAPDEKVSAALKMCNLW